MNLSEDTTSYLLAMAIDVTDAEDPDLSVGAQELLDGYNVVAGAFKTDWRPSVAVQAFLWDFVLSGREYLKELEETSDWTADLSSMLTEIHTVLMEYTH
jgi:hypothetical protein